MVTGEGLWEAEGLWVLYVCQEDYPHLAYSVGKVLN